MSKLRAMIWSVDKSRNALQLTVVLILFLWQFWTRFTGAEFNASIEEYNDNLDLLRKQDISYPVNGIVDFSTDSYRFPMTRSKNPMSIIEQCHSLLRASTRTHETVLFDKLETFSTVASLLSQGREWNPTDLQQTGDMDREEMIRALLYESKNEVNPVDALYDERYISQNSQFCRSETEDTGSPPFASFDYKNLYSTWLNINTSDTTLKELLSSSDVINIFGFYHRSVGNSGTLCACGHQVGTKCKLKVLGNEYREYLDQVTNVEEADANKLISYPFTDANKVRRALQRINASGWYECETQGLSDLTGILPSNLTAYLQESTNLTIDALDLMLFPKGGV